jgi:sec-independent protein translocase protein TatB
MFDIGFWEILVIAIVALLVVGPNEFPALVRTVGIWIGKIRRFMAETKHELDVEFRKAEELKRLMDREAGIAELHEQLDARKIEKVDQNTDKHDGANKSTIREHAASTQGKPAGSSAEIGDSDPSSSRPGHSSTRSSHGSNE